MDSLIETFHIDVKLLLAQIINFAVVISVLYFFALKPLIKVMKDRTATIEKSLSDAKNIEKKLNQTEADYKEKINEAKKDANAILIKAGEQAEAKKKEMLNKAKEEIGQIINSEKVQMQAEKAKILKEIKADVADLVVDSLEKILGKKVDKKEGDELIKKIIKK